MPFDFYRFLSRIDPAQTYVVHELVGGVVNFTVRAVKLQPKGPDSGHKGIFPEQESLILKHAPPYIAAIGEVAPMSEYRQVIEERVLSFLKQPFMRRIADRNAIRTPQVLYHDQEDFVLVLSDLGVLPTLSEFLFSLPMTLNDVQDNIMSANEAGRRIGRFLSELHSPETLTQISPNTLESFSNPARTSQSSIDGAALTAESHLKLFSVPDTPVLVSRVRENLQRRTTVQEIGFVNGDLSTGAILINPSSSHGATSITDITAAPRDFSPIGIIDFEFAGPGRTLNGDIAQLSALLQLHLMALPLNSAPYKIADAIGRGIMTAYRDKYRADHPEWSFYLQQQNIQPQAEKERNTSLEWVPQPPKVDTSIAQIMRSAFICHGAEIVNNTLWKEWPCACCNGDAPRPRTMEQKVGCELVRAMVEKGAWYLRSASDDEVDLLGMIIGMRCGDRQGI